MLLFVTGLVGFLAVALVIGVFAAAFWAPAESNIDQLVELISNAFLMLTGAIVGYIGGQGIERGRQGRENPPPDDDHDEDPEVHI